MEEANQIELTTNEMVAALALCGYDRIASQMLNEYGLIENENEFDRFVEQSELLLRQRGYWDENRDSQLSSGLESLLHLLVQSSRKVRCVKGKNVLFLHHLDKEYIMTQKVSRNVHAFAFHQSPFKSSHLLKDFYHLETSNENGIEQPSLELTEEMFNRIHRSDSTVLTQMLDDKLLDPNIRGFVMDFLENDQEFDNFSLLETDYIKDQSRFDQIVFLLPGNQFVWHMDYEQVNNNKIFLIPVSGSDYIEKIENTINEFFGD